MRSARTSLMPALSALLALLLLVTSTATPALAATYAAPLRSIPTAYAPTPGAPASQAYASLDESRFTSKSMSGSGVFLQRDPAGYEDSVNIYAGMKHDPVNNRDPTGARIRVADRKAQELLDRLANDALGHELIAYVRASPIEFVIYGEADLPRGVHGVTGNLAPELTPGRFPETDHERIGDRPRRSLRPFTETTYRSTSGSTLGRFTLSMPRHRVVGRRLRMSPEA